MMSEQKFLEMKNHLEALKNNLEKYGIRNKTTISVCPGTKIKKNSGETFKSGLLINSVRDVRNNPNNENEKVYVFYEDDSFELLNDCTLILK